MINQQPFCLRSGDRRDQSTPRHRGAQRRLLPKGGCDLPVYLFDIAGLA